MTDSTKKRIIFAGIAALVIIASLAAVFAIKAGAGKERGNMLSLAREYIDRNDFDRALDILDKLIIKNSGDREARVLQDEALAKKEAANGLAGEGDKNNALAQQLGEIGKSLERTASTVAKTAAASSGANPAANTAADAAARKAEDDARAKADADARAKAEKDAAAAAAKQREDELARKGKDLRDRMEAINALVKTGRQAVGNGDLSKASGAFNDATANLPAGEQRFASQTWSDIADSWYDAYKQAPTAPSGINAVKDAQRAAQEAIRADSTSASPHYTLSKIYNDANLPDQALSELEQAQKLDPNNYLYAYELGKAYFRVRKYEEAKRAFESVTTKLNTKYEPAFFNLGMTYRALRNDNGALASFRGAIALKPDYVRAHAEIGRLLASKGDYAGAVKSFNTALSFDAKDTSVMKELGVTYVSMNMLKEAEKVFEQALAISQDATTYYNLAKVKCDLRKFAEALPLAKKSVELAPQVSLFQYQLGLTAELSGDVDTAILAYGKSGELDKKAVDPRINLGKLYLESGFVDKALSVLEEAYRIDPKSLEANNNLGNAYGKKSVFSKSVFHYETALALSPRDLTIRINLARAYIQSDNGEKARDSYIEAIKLDGNAWDALYELGKLYVSMGDGASARKTFTDLLARKPDYKSRSEIENIMAGLR